VLSKYKIRMLIQSIKVSQSRFKLLKKKIKLRKINKMQKLNRL